MTGELKNRIGLVERAPEALAHERAIPPMEVSATQLAQEAVSLLNFALRGKCPKKQVYTVLDDVFLVPSARWNCTYFHEIEEIYDTEHGHRALYGDMIHRIDSFTMKSFLLYEYSRRRYPIEFKNSRKMAYDLKTYVKQKDARSLLGAMFGYENDKLEEAIDEMHRRYGIVFREGLNRFSNRKHVRDILVRVYERTIGMTGTKLYTSEKDWLEVLRRTNIAPPLPDSSLFSSIREWITTGLRRMRRDCTEQTRTRPEATTKNDATGSIDAQRGRKVA